MAIFHIYPWNLFTNLVFSCKFLLMLIIFDQCERKVLIHPELMLIVMGTVTDVP